MTDPIIVLWEKYGWVAFLLYFIVREIWPFLRDKVWPQTAANAKLEADRIRKLEDRQITLQERHAIAVEEMSKAVQSMALVITTNNERLSSLLIGFAQHSQESTAAITLMRERTARNGVPRKVKSKL
ncbi:MAG: hypothetical protein HY863_15685 [Chloroflexi bacterium]|nr:hypothetical protein [Chloroflexota bacterium]